MVDGEKESSRRVVEEMRAHSLAVVVPGGLASTRGEQGLSLVGEERPRVWGISPSPHPRRASALGKFCGEATGRAGKKCPICSRSHPTTEIPTATLPKWRR